MRTSLNEIKLIDGYIFNNNSTEDGLLFDAMLIVDPQLSNKVSLQQMMHIMVQQHARKQLKAEIESAHQKLFYRPEHKNFRQKILGFFQ